MPNQKIPKDQLNFDTKIIQDGKIISFAAGIDFEKIDEIDFGIKQKKECTMGLTNKFNLPQPFADAVKGYEAKYKESFKEVSRLSVTTLIGSPLIRILKAKYEDVIEEDVSDRMWMLMGSLVHKLLEEKTSRDHLAEERLYTVVDGVKISGQADFYGEVEGIRILDDYKFTGVLSVTSDIKPEWIWQLNILNYLFSKSNFYKAADKLRIIAILKDWSKARAKVDSNYPQCIVKVIDIHKMDEEDVLIFIQNRIRLHLEAEKYENIDDIPICTPVERWTRIESYAVMKAGGKRAISGGVHKTENAAEAFLCKAQIEKPGEYYVERREKADVRCKDYCPVVQYCKHGKQYVGLE